MESSMPIIKPSPRISRMKGEFCGQRGKAFAQFGASLADIFQKFLVFDDTEKFESGGAAERAAAERGAVQAGRDALGDGFGREDRTERESCGERLRYHHDIRLRGEFLVREVTAGAT